MFFFCTPFHVYGCLIRTCVFFFCRLSLLHLMYMLKMWHAHIHWNMKALMTSLILFFIAWMFYWRKNVIFPRLFKNSFVPSAPFRPQFASIWWKKKSRYFIIDNAAPLDYLVALSIISELGLFLIHSLACEIYCSSLGCNLFWFLAWFMEKDML